MSVREAKFVDIPAIVEVLSCAHGKSKYAETAKLDLGSAKHLFASSMQRHGHKNYGASLVLVSETEGKVRGVMLGMLDQVYPCLDKLVATDVLFVVGPKAGPGDAFEMLERLMRWAEDCPKVIEIRLGITDAMGSWERTERMYQRMGLQPSGAMMGRSIER